MSTELQRFFAALMFFTRIPCPAWVSHSDLQMRHAAKYFPLVGLLVGATASLIAWLTLRIYPQPIAILLSMVATLLITGAIHEDGFADTCDGFGGGQTREQILHIMQDSHIGTFGTVGLILLLTLKFETLTLLPPEILAIVLITGHSVSRLIAISFLHTHVYVRPDGTGKSHAIAQKMPIADLALAVVFGLAPLALFSLRHALLALVVLLVTRLLIGRYLTHRLGGYTGDCLGASQQVTEILFYLAVLAMS
ncbi:MAG: adenosylcobinamide-GDP ribazoletransferase [Ferrovum sp.]|nr:adenosylcobinamide-GDP ribazoletransferase [Ferrovum sp.]